MKSFYLALFLIFALAQVASAEKKSVITIKDTFQKCKTDKDCSIVPVDCSHSATGCKAINKKYLEKIEKPDCSNYKGEVSNYECMDDAALCVSGMCQKYETFGKPIPASECDRLKALSPNNKVLERCKN